MPTQLCTMELSNTDEGIRSNKERDTDSTENSVKLEENAAMDLDVSLTQRKKMIVESCATNGHTIQLGPTIGRSTVAASPISLNESACSVIDIQDSTPDISCELLTVGDSGEGKQIVNSSSNDLNAVSTPVSFQKRLGPPVRHSDIYITDVYNVNDHSIESSGPEVPPEPAAALETITETASEKADEVVSNKGSNDSVQLFRKVREYVGDFLEPPVVPTPTLPSPPPALPSPTPSSVISPPIDSPPVPVEAVDPIRNECSYLNLCMSVNCTILRTKAADGGTINELVSVRCDECLTSKSNSFGSSGIRGDVSCSSSSELPPPPPPPAGSSIHTRHVKSRFSHASSTSSTSASSIASSASALARINAAAIAAAVAIAEHSDQTTPAPTINSVHSLSHERISHLRDKWINSREIWRLLDHIDRFLEKNQQVVPSETKSIETNVANLSSPKRGRKTKQTEDSEWLKPDEQVTDMPRPAKRRKATPSVTAVATATPTVSNEPEVSAYNVGSQVFAKWTDRRFYAATLVKTLPEGRWLVEFYDGNRRPVSEEHMLYVDDVALIGQKVFARARSPTDPGVPDDFQAGIVTECEPDESGTRLMFTVARNDNDIRVPSEYILLTEYQVRQVKKNPSANGDHRTSPLPNTPSTFRSTRSKTRCVTNRVDSPVPGSSGIQRRMRYRNASSNGQTTRQRGRGRPRRQASEAKSVTSTSTEENQYVDYDDYDDDDDSSTTNCTNGDGTGIGYSDTIDVSGLEPEAAASYDASGRIKGKTVDGKATRFGHEPREEEAAALGPMPAPGVQPFKGMHVLLSCATESALLTTAATDAVITDKVSDCGGDGDGVSSCASGVIDFKFSNRPFVKARLRAQLIAGGATVHDSLEDVPSQKLGQTYLIANRPSRTATYVACIAAGARVYCHDWVIRCCAEGKYLQPQELPYGWSIEKERYFMSYERQRAGQGSGCAALKRRFVLISDGGDSHFTGYWTHVLKLSGATVKNLSLCDDNEVSRALCVLCDCGHRDERAVHAHSRGVPLVTTTWLVQTLIHGELRKFNITCYQPDYVDHSD